MLDIIGSFACIAEESGLESVCFVQSAVYKLYHRALIVGLLQLVAFPSGNAIVPTLSLFCYLPVSDSQHISSETQRRADHTGFKAR